MSTFILTAAQIEEIKAFMIKKGTLPKLWEKGDMKRIYFKYGHNTKKVTTKAWLDLTTLEFGVDVDCPSQDGNWEASQEERFLRELKKYSRLMKIAFRPKTQEVIDAVKEIENAKAAANAEIVQGWYLDFKMVTGNYGKHLGQKPHIGTYKGPKGNAPRGLQPLSDIEFSRAEARKGERLPAYTTPDFSA